MRVRIHRGTKEIGGSCIELEANRARILLDLGLPLDGNPDDALIHPAVAGLAGGVFGNQQQRSAADKAGELLALVLSHAHLDHYGLTHLARPDLPVAMGAATHRILAAAAPFVPRPYVPLRVVEFANLRMDCQVPPPHHPLRATRRHPQSLHNTRMRRHLPQSNQTVSSLTLGPDEKCIDSAIRLAILNVKGRRSRSWRADGTSRI